VIGIGVVALLALFYVLGRSGQEDAPPAANRVQPTPTPTPDGGASNGGDKSGTPARRRPRRVRLQLVATGSVYVCLVDAAGKQVIDEQTLAAGTTTRTFRSRSFRTNFGNDNVTMRVNGKSYPVAASPDPVGYELLPGKRPKRLSDAQRPDCSA
jgi:cytoskeleton protein RodZ